ncbi:Hsp20/alpha crystallin family protein [Bacteriovoracaceae bacterium]|nr:Hsp20/alpha crystallin family protein [Bacteriovoracaceae bacterium]
MNNLMRNRQRDLNSFWDHDPFSLFYQAFNGRDGNEVAEKRHAPVCHISDRGDFFLISLDLPGVNKEHVDVEVKDGYLNIKGERHTEVKSNDYTERRYGQFERSFKISEDMDIERIKAEFNNGELNLEIGKKSSPTSRKITLD